MEKKNLYIQNLIAALTVSFVALSLGAAFGILSGRGVFAGMISAAIFASVTSALGGTRVQCSGPTGPMTAVTAVIVGFAFSNLLSKIPSANPNHFVNLVIILSGVIMVLFGVFKFGKYIKYIPNVVVSGFMNGIAIIIWADQVRKIFGIGGKKAFEGDVMQNLILVILSASLVFLIPVFTKKYMPKFASILSATFITIILVSTLAFSFHFNVERVKLESSLNSISDFTSLVAINIPHKWTWDIIKLALPFAIQLAILGYLDTLMTSLVVDKLTKESTKQNKELVAQGIAAGAVALIGGIPGAQATIRSVLIVKEKATLRIAGVMVGVFALLEMLVFQDAINMIPQAVFAGILIKVGYDVFDWLPVKIYTKELIARPSLLLKHFLSRHDEIPVFITNREMIIIVGTTLVTVFYDLNLAVGVFTALFYLHNKVLVKNNQMRDLKEITETEAFSDEE